MTGTLRVCLKIHTGLIHKDDDNLSKNFTKIVICN